MCCAGRAIRRALAAYEEARAIFEQQNEPATVATIWHQIGMVHQEAGHYDEAEAAYRHRWRLRPGTTTGPGRRVVWISWGLYGDYLNRPEEAVTFYRQAADIYVELGDLRYEGVTRNNIADTLRKLKRYDEARHGNHAGD